MISSKNIKKFPPFPTGEDKPEILEKFHISFTLSLISQLYLKV